MSGQRVQGSGSLTLGGSDSLVVTDRGSVRYIEFNRPEVHNAQDVAMLEALDEVLRVTAKSRDVRAVVLGGVGRSFCSGHNLNQMATNADYRRNFSAVESRFEDDRLDAEEAWQSGT